MKKYPNPELEALFEGIDATFHEIEKRFSESQHTQLQVPLLDTDSDTVTESRALVIEGRTFTFQLLPSRPWGKYLARTDDELAECRTKLLDLVQNKKSN